MSRPFFCIRLRTAGQQLKGARKDGIRRGKGRRLRCFSCLSLTTSWMGGRSSGIQRERPPCAYQSLMDFSPVAAMRFVHKCRNRRRRDNNPKSRTALNFAWRRRYNTASRLRIVSLANLGLDWMLSSRKYSCLEYPSRKKTQSQDLWSQKFLPRQHSGFGRQILFFRP